MNVTVNGQPRPVTPGTTVAELVEQVAGGAPGTAVAVGETVVPRKQWPVRVLHEGDVVELLTAVPGG